MRRLATAFLIATTQTAAAGSDWAAVNDVLSERCVLCHSGEDAPLGLDLTTFGGVMAGSVGGAVVQPGDPDASRIIRRIEGLDLPRMPLDGPPWLDAEQVAVIRGWIVDGAADGDTPVTPAAVAPRQRPAPGAPVTFADIEPVLLKRCIKCHSDNSKLGSPPEGLRLDGIAAVLAGGERLAVVPGNPELSELWRRVAGLGLPRMPFDGPPWLPPEDIAMIRDWIAQGAPDAQGRPAPVPTGARVRLRGILTATDSIDGGHFRVTSGTRIDKSPRVGAAAEMRGVVGADGQVTATRLRRR